MWQVDFTNSGSNEICKKVKLQHFGINNLSFMNKKARTTHGRSGFFYVYDPNYFLLSRTVLINFPDLSINLTR